MSRKIRTDKINEIAINKFIMLYFDEKYPNNEYKISIINQNPLQLKILNLEKKYNWILYSASTTNDLLNDIKVEEFKKHLSAFKIQQCWKTLFYDPKNRFIEPFLTNNLNNKNNKNNKNY